MISDQSAQQPQYTTYSAQQRVCTAEATDKLMKEWRPEGLLIKPLLFSPPILLHEFVLCLSWEATSTWYSVNCPMAVWCWIWYLHTGSSITVQEVSWWSKSPSVQRRCKVQNRTVFWGYERLHNQSTNRIQQVAIGLFHHNVNSVATLKEDINTEIDQDLFLLRFRVNTWVTVSENFLNTEGGISSPILHDLWAFFNKKKQQREDHTYQVCTFPTDALLVEGWEKELHHATFVPCHSINPYSTPTHLLLVSHAAIRFYLSFRRCCFQINCSTLQLEGKEHSEWSKLPVLTAAVWF